MPTITKDGCLRPSPFMEQICETLKTAAKGSYSMNLHLYREFFRQKGTEWWKKKEAERLADLDAFMVEQQPHIDTALNRAAFVAPSTPPKPKPAKTTPVVSRQESLF